MNFHWPFFGKPEPTHVVPRFHAATREESAAARNKRAEVMAELNAAVASLTPEQRREAVERAASRQP